MKKRILIFALAIFTLLTLTSCGKKFTVTFNADGGTLAGEATVQVKKGKTISEPTAPTRDGYTFAGWYNGETKYDFSSKVTSDITLVARWSGQTEFKDPVTITFDSMVDLVLRQLQLKEVQKLLNQLIQQNLVIHLLDGIMVKLYLISILLSLLISH